MSDSAERRKRGISDRVIAGLNSARYSLFEPTWLLIERMRFEASFKTDDNPLVTVCVPTFNRGAILVERAVESVLNQTHTNLELMIVGDHCTDDTEQLLSKISDPRLRFLNLQSRKKSYRQNIENHWLVGGAAPANAAMKLATGKWIARVDDDDTWTDDHIEKLLKFAIDGNYEFVSALYEEERFGVRKVVDGLQANDPYFTRKPLPKGDSSPKIGGVSTWLYRSYLKFMKYNVNCWRKDWNRVWDIDLALRIYGAGARMGFLPETLAYVLPRPGEESVGLEAYKLMEDEKLELYKF